ncbi:MAG: CHASE3 domain-containing protein [Betaproteobacteria bacterium]|nr:CHASE3 domain-containing protein [Betaproteobacteria bacterium]
MPVISFCAALAILAGISAVSYRSLQEFVERARWVEQTQDVLREADAVLSDLKDVETGDRGYLISGEESFLVPYVDALASIPARLRRLKELTADNGDQQKRILELEKLVDQRLRQAALFLKTAGTKHMLVSEPTRKHIAQGKLTMDEIRDVVSNMRTREEMLLVERAQDSKRSSNMATAIIVAGTLTSFTMLVVAFVFLRKEIEQRARAEHAAQASAAEIESLYNEAPCGYHSVDEHGTFVRINDTELAWLGYDREEVVGKLKFIDVVAPECVQTVQENFPKLVKGAKTTNLEYTMVRRNGSTFPVSVNAVPLLDADGNYVMSRTTMFDITAMKQVEHQYRQANAFLDAVVENIPSMIFVKEAKTLRFARINRAEEELLGMPREALIGKSDHELFPKDQADLFTAKDREVLAAPGVVEIPEEKLTTANGTLILRTRKIGLRDAYGRPQYLLGISDDITEAKRAEEAIRALNASLQVRANQLEAANKDLEGFSYSVSHDLRAPLRAIDGFTKIFEEDYGGQIDDEGRRLLRVIRENSRRMGLLIDDLLAFSRLGRQPLSTEQTDMNSLALEALDQVHAGGLGTNASTVIHDLPAARVDRSLLKQVWINLLSNALKYSSTRESPQIEVGSLTTENALDHLIFFVKDNGVGFDMRYYDKLFGVFQRLHRVDEFSGTGVGLAIVHRLITRHGGRVWAEAELNRGATFFFSVPVGGQDDRV